MFKKATPEEQAAKDEAKAAARAEKERLALARRVEQEREEFLRTPVGQAQSTFDRGGHVFQYSLDVLNQGAVIVAMIGSANTKRTSDPSELLNAVCAQGWELVNGSFVFVHEGEQSRYKFLSSGQNVATKGRIVGYYLFKRCEANRQEAARNLPATAKAA
jgi:hypothetical protein